MLVLSRKVREAVTIRTPSGDVIRVILTEMRGDKCRLGFSAPKPYAIYRDELLQGEEREDPPATDDSKDR